MNSRRESFFCNSPMMRLQNNQAQRMDDYLDHLCAPLVGSVPIEARNDFREEARAHLEALIAEYRELEMVPDEALETAFREFGEPEKMGRAFMREWVRKTPHKTFSTRTPTACAFAWFGAVTVINLLWLEWPTVAAPWQNSAWPTNFWPIQGLTAVAGFTPLVAGLLTGLTQPHPDGKAVLRVQGALTLFTLLFGLTLLRQGDILKLAVFQLLWWLPIGYLTTVTIGTMAQRLRRPHFLLAPASRRHAL